MDSSRDRNRTLLRIGMLAALILAGGAASSSDVETQKKRDWGTAVGGRALSVATDNSRYFPEQRIALNILYKNVGDSEITVPVRSDFTDFEVTVIFDGRDVVPKTRYGKQMESAGGSQWLRTLRPGQVLSRDLPLSRYFDFSIKGKYAICVKTEIPGIRKAGEQRSISSNTLEIAVGYRENERDSK